MRTRFYIEKRKDNNGKILSAECPVFMSVSFKGNRVIVGTGIKTDLNAWDHDKQRVKASFPEEKNHNAWLNTMEDTARKTMEAMEYSGNPSDSGSFLQLFQKLRPKYSAGFFELFFHFMESNSSTWSNATYRKIRSLYKTLREFEEHTGFSISFPKLNDEFLESFISYCTTKEYKYSTTYKTVNNLVWFLNWATQNGYNAYTEYKQFYKQMKAPEEKSTLLVFLNWDELMHLKDYNLENRKMDRVRDLFCFMCFAGVRYTELQNLKKEDLKPEVIMVRKPGGGARQIPMNKYALQIHKKYENKYYLNNTAFPAISIITMNKYLRIIGKEAGMTRLVPSQKEGEERLVLYKRLTAGIAVNTFINSALELGIPVEIISGYTGVQNDSRIRHIKADQGLEEMKKFDQR